MEGGEGRASSEREKLSGKRRSLSQQPEEWDGQMDNYSFRLPGRNRFQIRCATMSWSNFHFSCRVRLGRVYVHRNIPFIPLLESCSLCTKQSWAHTHSQTQANSQCDHVDSFGAVAAGILCACVRVCACNVFCVVFR